MIEPAWIGVGISGGVMLASLGGWVVTVRMQGGRLDRQETLMGTLDSKLDSIIAANPVLEERIKRLDAEQNFQRGRIHEMSNQIASNASIHDERHTALAREIERIRNKLDGNHH